MGYSYIHREEPLETLTARVIGAAVDFAERYCRAGPFPAGLARRDLPRLLDHFARGVVSDARDDACFEAIGRALIASVNDRCPGYGERVLRGEAREDMIFDPKLAERVRLLREWDSLRHARIQLRARLAARELLAQG